MKTDYLHTPIFITGIERSGGILVSNILQACDVHFGKTDERLENKRIKCLVDSYYKSIGCPIKGQYPLPSTEEMLIPSDWKQLVVDSICADKYESGVSWGYHSARIAQIWPIWNYAFPNAKWVIVRRKTGDIINSCIQTGYMDAFKNMKNLKEVNVTNERDGWLWHIHENEKLFIEMHNAGVNCKIVWPERIINGDLVQLYELIDWLGLKWNMKCFNIINPLIQKTWQE